MADSTSTERRTRSQIQLPDNVLQLNRSPLKEARAASRNHPESVEDVAMEYVDDNLAQTRVSSGSKRSPSPDSTEPNARAKRLKPDVDLNSSNSENINSSSVRSSAPNHARHHSDSNIIPPGKRRKRSATSSKPASTVQPATQYFSPVPTPMKGRARSVPLFSTMPIPVIDFRHPPPSPVRTRSRSSSKEVFIIKPISPIKEVESNAEESSSVVIADDNIPSRAAPVNVVGPSTEPLTPSQTIQSAEVVAEASESSNTSSVPPFVASVQMSTPIHNAVNSTPMSPLTPVPETPFPARTIPNDDRYLATEGWNSVIGRNETSVNETESRKITQSKPSTLFAGVSTKSRLPRPTSVATSSSFKLTTSYAIPPPLPPPVASSSKHSSTKSAPITKNNASMKHVTNALALMMDKAKAKSSKGKEVAVPIPYSSSVAPTANSKTQKGKGKEKELEKEAAKPATIKAKMKPRERPKETVPHLLLLESDDDEADTEDSGSGMVGAPMEPPATSPMSPLSEMDFELSAEKNKEEVKEVFASRPSSLFSELDPLVQVQDEVMVVDLSTTEKEVPPAAINSPSLFSELKSSVHQDKPMDNGDSIPGQSIVDSPLTEPSSLFSEQNNDVDEGQGVAIESNRLGSSVAVVEDTIAVDSVIQGSTKMQTALQEPAFELGTAPATATVPGKPKGKRQPGKKRVPKTFTAAGSRVTRSVSSKQKTTTESTPEIPSPASKFSTTDPSMSSMPLPSSSVLTTAESVKLDDPIADMSSISSLSDMSSISSLSDISTDSEEAGVPAPIAPTSTSAKTRVSKAANKEKPSSSKAKSKSSTSGSSFAKPMKASFAKKIIPSVPKTPRPKAPSRSFTSLAISKTPSPTKLPTRTPTRTTSMFGRFLKTGDGTALNVLENALEKLRMPPPSRPNTSLGFSREEGSDSLAEVKSKDDTSVSKAAVGLGRPDGSSGVAGPSSSKPALSVSKPKSMFMPVGTGPGLSVNKRPGAVMRGGRMGTTNRFSITGSSMGSGFRQKASQQTSLPSVMASPVKGGQSAVDDSDVEMQGEEPVNAGDATLPTDLDLFLTGPSTGKGKEKDSDNRKKDGFRRASLAHQALSQSLSSLPIEKPKEIMGPPATPPRRGGLRSSSSTYPSSSSSVATTKSNKDEEKKNTLDILQDCKVFVDIREESGEDASSWFIDALKDLGARIMTRIGSTCTHIVFKDGLASTVNRYRQLNDPKPYVVGVTWVVECIEQVQHVQEDRFIIDLQDFKFSAGHKRRKSMIPKLIPSFDFGEAGQNGDADISMESSSSMIDDSLPPLEKARLRQSLLASRT